MRRPPPNFKVERVNRRSTQRASDLLDAPSMDDVPTRDIRSDETEGFDRRQTEDEPYADRARQQANKFFSKRNGKPPEAELSIDSLDIFPPMRVAQTAPVAAPEPEPEAPPVRRILQSTTWVDPVEQRIREADARRATRKPRQPREPREPRQNGRRQRSEAIFESQAPELPLEAPRAMPTGIPNQPQQAVGELPRLNLRRRHPEPRILYNAWGYRCFLAEARSKPKEVAEIILKPGETWRRRLPVATWR